MGDGLMFDLTSAELQILALALAEHSDRVWDASDANDPDLKKWHAVRRLKDRIENELHARGGVN